MCISMWVYIYMCMYVYKKTLKSNHNFFTVTRVSCSEKLESYINIWMFTTWMNTFLYICIYNKQVYRLSQLCTQVDRVISTQ